MINPETEFRFDESALTTTATGWTLRWSVPAELSYFAGHFPQNPVLPAVAMLDGSLEALRLATGQTEVRLQHLKSAKFMQPILPHQTIEISLERSPDPGRWWVKWYVRSPVANTEVTETQLAAEFSLSLY